MLHVTNGDSTQDVFERASLEGEVLVWRDVLHEGPVPAGLSQTELAAVRARFLAEADGTPFDGVLAVFAERDRTLAAASGEVALWFEWDLYDQLQLVEVLDRLGERAARSGDVTLISVAGYLGELAPEDVEPLFAGRTRVTSEQVALARRAWGAFRSPDPVDVASIAKEAPTALPFLADGLTRHLQQFPAVEDGLARTERQILEAVAGGARTRMEIFLADHQREERLFMGDATFWRYIDRLLDGDAPALARHDGGVQLTVAGERLLAGEADWVHANGIDRWLGGVHLHGREAAWRWSGADARLVAA